jgi:predicted esterase
LSNVPVQSEAQRVEFGGWTLRVRTSAALHARLLLLLHGWTGDENSMWVFVQNFAADYWIVAPRAPYITKPSGYSWRPLQPGHREPPTLDDLRPSSDALIGLADAYSTANHLHAEQFDIVGFSQGAALCNTLMLLRPGRIRRAGILAGFVPIGAEALVAGHPLDGKPVFVAHGSSDEMVKIEHARQSIDLLQRAGASVTFCEDDVGHRVSVGCLHALETFFA